MNPMSIRSATEVYGNASRCEINRHWVNHSALAEVSRSLRTLVQLLGDDATDDFWRRTLSPIRRTAFGLCSTPLSFAQIGSAVGVDFNELHRAVRQSQQLFPDANSLLSSIVVGLGQLVLETTSPLIPPLETLSEHHGPLAVILRDPRMHKAVSSFFAESRSLRNATIVSAPQLRGSHHCGVLVAIGPCSWFPEYVFAAPRATTIHVLSYRWIRDAWKPGPLFLHNDDSASSRRSSHGIGTLPKVSGERAQHETVGPAADDMHPPELVPAFPFFAGLNGSQSGGSGSHHPVELVRARLCQLSGNRAVFVAADEGSSCLTIDTSNLGTASVRRVRAHALEQGLYVLLRTSAGGDFIAPLADRILGHLASQRRSEQAKWKAELLRAATERFGTADRREVSSRICAELHAKSLSRARPPNVHYWMGSKCIRPRKSEDFAAIMAFAGFADAADRLWSAMGEIDRAHRQAGHLIRQMLMQKIAETSLAPLERDGEMDFDLGEQGGGSISAYQITGVTTQEYDVPGDRVGVLLDLEGSTWHA